MNDTTEYLSNASSDNHIYTTDDHVVIVGDIHSKNGPPLVIRSGSLPVIITGSIYANKIIFLGVHPVIVCGSISCATDISSDVSLTVLKSCQTSFGNIRCASDFKVGTTLKCKCINIDGDVVASNAYIDGSVYADHLVVLGDHRVSGSLNAGLRTVS